MSLIMIIQFYKCSRRQINNPLNLNKKPEMMDESYYIKYNMCHDNKII